MKRGCDMDMEREEHTEEEKAAYMQAHYDELKAYYEEHASLPEGDMKKEHMGEMRHKKEGMKEMKEEYADASQEEKEAMKQEYKEAKRAMKTDRKHFKEEHRGVVRSVVKSVSHDRLEKALSRIELVLASAEDEKIIDLLEGIKEVIEEVLDTDGE
jgi:protoporphyrinogen oxidase